jgi:hypothetical protein
LHKFELLRNFEVPHNSSLPTFLISAFQNRETPRKEKEKRKEKKEAGGDFLEWRDKRAWKKGYSGRA